MTEMEIRPKLRAVEAIPFQSGGEQLVCLRDPSGGSAKTVVMPARAFLVAALCDGEHTLRDIQTEYVRRFGNLIFLEKVAEMVRQLDEALLLEGQRYERHRRARGGDVRARGEAPRSVGGKRVPGAAERAAHDARRLLHGPGRTRQAARAPAKP